MADAATRPRRIRGRTAGELPRILCIAGFVIFVLVPLYWMVITSIKPTSDYLALPPVWFPAEPTIVHYTAALFSYRGLDGLTNSIIIASAATVLSTVLGTLMAYSWPDSTPAVSTSLSGCSRNVSCPQSQPRYRCS